MLRTLIKKQLLELFQSYFVDRKTGKARKKAGTVVFFVFFVVLILGLGAVFFMVSQSVGAYTLNRGSNWLYFALMGLLSMALGVFGSVFNTYASVYLPKDNELLLSMPIPPVKLLLARTVSLFLMSLLYSGWIWIPAVIAYFCMVELTPFRIIFPILLIFVIALFVSVLSCLLGFIVAIIASKAKGKSFLTVFLSLLVLGGYYFVYFRIVNSLDEIILYIDEWSSTVKNWLHYSYLLGMAADGDVMSLIYVILITVALAAFCMFLLSKSFYRVALNNTKSAKKEKVSYDIAQRSPMKALVMREYKHFTSVATWMLNGGFGLLILVLIAVFALIKMNTFREVLGGFGEDAPELIAALPVIVASAINLIISTTGIAPVSISMEGRTLWILQSMPVDTKMIIRAKERMSVQALAVPGLITTAILGFVCRFEPWDIAMTMIIVLLFIYLSSDFGLLLNIKSPNFSWTSEASVTKQSMPVVVSMFAGWLFCAVIGFAAGFLCQLIKPYFVLGGMMLLLFAVRELLWLWLMKKGTRLLKYM